MNEYDNEPIRGLPERPPAGERILWQGAPAWKSLARRLFRMPLVIAYFAVMMAWRLAASTADGSPFDEAVLSALMLVPVLLGALALLGLLAWLIARSTVYTITTRRIVMRFGVALPMSINIPFSAIASAQMKAYPDGTGDVSVALIRSQRFSYVMGWPHVRPWRIGRPEPTLRCVADAAAVAEILARALSAMEPLTQPAQARPVGKAAPVSAQPLVNAA